MSTTWSSDNADASRPTGGRRRRPRVLRPDISASGVITAMGSVAGDSDSCMVKIDRRKAATLLESDRVSLGLHVDQAIDEALAQAIAIRHEYRLAWRWSMQRIGRKARTRRDMKQALVGRGHAEDVVAEVLDRLCRIGALNDDQFASMAADSLARRSPASARFIESRLRASGVDSEVARLAAAAAAGDPEEAAMAVALRARRSLKSQPPEVRKRRLWGRLARRGFDADIINRVLQRVEQEAG